MMNKLEKAEREKPYCWNWVFDAKSETEGLSSFESDIRSVAKGELMELYLNDERNLIQKCNFFHRFVAAAKKRKRYFWVMFWKW